MNSEVVHYDTSDRLSELPDELLIQILSFLPIKDAVRTVLLRRFGNLWTLLPTLTFDYSEEDEDDIEVEEEEEFISNVLKFHKSPTIDQLEFHEVFFDLEDSVNECIYFAIRKKTKALSVRGSDNLAYYDLPPCVFSTQSIVSLYLDHMAITLPPRVSMGSLKILSLTFVYFDEAALEGIISGCPCLQELIVLEAHIIQDQLHISSPTIEKLFLSVDRDNRGHHEMVTIDCPNLKILRIKQTSLDFLRLTKVSSVCEAVIEYCPSYCCKRPKSTDQFKILLHKFFNAHLFQLGDEAYLQLQQCDSQKLDFQENRWTRLALRSVIEGSCLLGICRLLRNSRHLKELVIYADVDFSCNCNMLLHELSSPCLMQKLKNITIREYKKPCEGLLQLMKFLLRSAVALEKLVVVFIMKDQVNFLEEDDFIWQFSSFPRASRKVSVAFVKEIR